MGDAELGNVYYNTANTGAYGGVFRLKRAANTSKNVTEAWLKKQRVYTLHKPARLRYVTRPYKTASIDQQWQADLVEMIPYANVNDGYRYMLTVIDLFSRFAWARPIKDKTGKQVKHAFQDIFATGRKCQRLQTDEGREFDNRHVQRLLNRENIKFFTVKSQFKAAVSERFNRTLKSKMWRYFTHRGTYKWIDILPELIDAYNASKHRSIGMAPKDVNADIERDLWTKQDAKGPQKVSARESKATFRVGDEVRLSKAKKVFQKGYLPNWTEEIFTISRVFATIPIQYKVQDYRNDEIDGSFYVAELQKVVKPEQYAIERVIRTQNIRGRMRYFVKWLGFSDEHNSWVDHVEGL